MVGRVCVILPAYNEGKVIYNVLKSIQKEGFHNIIVVDDASKDNTLNEAKKAKVEVVSHAKNKGPGGATRTGLHYAHSKGFDYAVFLDSDGQHDPKDISLLLKYASNYDVVIGSRMLKRNMPLSRKIINFAGSLITWFFFGLYVKDSQSGFKVFNRKAMEKIKFKSNGFEFCSEIIGQIHKRKLSFKEVPIKVIYTKYSLSKKHGQSFFKGFRMIWRFVKLKVRG